jgi:hypothetical protein
MYHLKIKPKAGVGYQDANNKDCWTRYWYPCSRINFPQIHMMQANIIKQTLRQSSVCTTKLGPILPPGQNAFCSSQENLKYILFPQ